MYIRTFQTDWTYLDYTGKVLRDASDLERDIDVVKTHGCNDERCSKDCDQPNLGYPWDSGAPNELDGDVYEYSIGDRICCRRILQTSWV
jgi:hypothetical protein